MNNSLPAIVNNTHIQKVNRSVYLLPFHQEYDEMHELIIIPITVGFIHSLLYTNNIVMFEHFLCRYAEG